jgi:DnaK suppressor protein
MRKITLPERYKPSEDEEYMNDMQLKYFEQKLLAWKEELLTHSRETLNHLKEGNWNEPDLSDCATIATNTTLELRTGKRYLNLLSKIDEALKRIESGTYGYCEDTGEEIGIKRLDARPVADLCVEAQERREKYKKEHADDEIS